MSRDKIFAEIIQKPSDFIFDEKVASVFPDMVQRSIPGYSEIIRMIGSITAIYAKSETCLYDLGCSLGAAAFSMAASLEECDRNCKIIAADNSKPMIEKAVAVSKKKNFKTPLSFQLADITSMTFEPSSVIALNFTLQFIPPAKRKELLEKLYKSLVPGGVLVLSEKVIFEDPSMNELFIDAYHNFKHLNGYSRLEISQKRTALENVLIPESIAAHKKRLLDIGFTIAEVWFQCFNFMSLIAIK